MLGAKLSFYDDIVTSTQVPGSKIQIDWYMTMNRNIKVEPYYTINTVERLSNSSVSENFRHYTLSQKILSDKVRTLKSFFCLRTSRMPPFVRPITRTFNQDYTFGKANEAKSLPILNKFFNSDLTHIEDQYAPFDFESSKYAIEQKSRNCSVRDYPTTMLQYKKIEHCKLPCYKKQQKWFIFRF